MRKLMTIAGAMVLVLSGLVAGTTPASAHYTYGYHGNDFASINDDHSLITVCDREVDGHYAYVKMVYDGNVVTERDGGDAGCDTAQLGLFFDAVYVCEEAKGCNRIH